MSAVHYLRAILASAFLLASLLCVCSHATATAAAPAPAKHACCAADAGTAHDSAVSKHHPNDPACPHCGSVGKIVATPGDHDASALDSHAPLRFPPPPLLPELPIASAFEARYSDSTAALPPPADVLRRTCALLI